MHELGLCEDIVAAVEQRAAGRAVARVRVRVGRLHHVHPEAFEQSFAMAAAGGVAEEATAELVLLPVRARCGACGGEAEADELMTACPACGSFDLELTGGDELVLESLEYASPAATGR
ncbi:MAG TPA: hydrogenase maturation nickel metallochaperone HypA [Acidimicrobiales bacterium]|jgi:hydrogenase nickel incorporation protein HypA/HybF